MPASNALSQRVERLLYHLRGYSWLKDWPRLRRGQLDGVIDKPVFLLGMQGGGLTLLSRMLRRHPEVVSATGGVDYWSGADEIQNVYGLFLPPDLTGLRYKAPPHPVLTAPRSWTYATDELLPAYRRTEAAATPELREALERVIRYCIGRFGPRSGRARFVDKSQVYTVRAGLLHGLLSGYQPRFVLVPRDPYVSVHRAAAGKAGDMARLMNVLSYEQRIQYCAEHYLNSVSAAFEDCDRLGAELLVVQFEQLVASPDAELRRVCDFVELDFRQDMLPSASHRIPLGSRFRDRWYPVKADVNRPYVSSIDELTRRCINERGADLVRRLGYPVLD